MKLTEGHEIDKFVVKTGNDYFALTVRLPTKKDATKVRRCIESIIGREENVRFFRTVTQKGQEQFMEETLQKLKKKRELFVVGEVEGKIVMIAALMKGDFKVDEHVADFVIGIMGSYRGKGIGTKVTESLFSIAPQIGIRVIRSSYEEGNYDIRNFYKKLGFSEIGKMPHGRRLKGKLFDEVIVVKKL